MAEIKLCVIGARGRLGQRICALASDSSLLNLSAGVVRDGVPTDVAGALYTSDLESALGQADVVIDVSSPSTCLAALPLCREKKIAYICGTTGLGAAEKDALAQAANDIPVMLAANFSIGVNVLRKLVAQAAQLLGDDFVPEIFEIHHGKKKDAPSGTALALGEELKEVRPDLQEVFDRSATDTERGAGDLGYSALRGGDVAGEHTVFFFGEAERIELTHRATSRDIFARGALRAAEFLHQQAAGTYTMQDVLKVHA